MESGKFPGVGGFVSRMAAHISVTKKTERDEEDNVKNIQIVRKRRAKKSTARLRTKVAVDWIGEDFHPRPAIGCGRCFRAGELVLPHPTSVIIDYLAKIGACIGKH